MKEKEKTTVRRVGILFSIEFRLTLDGAVVSFLKGLRQGMPFPGPLESRALITGHGGELCRPGGACIIPACRTLCQFLWDGQAVHKVKPEFL